MSIHLVQDNPFEIVLRCQENKMYQRDNREFAILLHNRVAMDQMLDEQLKTKDYRERKYSKELTNRKEKIHRLKSQNNYKYEEFVE